MIDKETEADLDARIDATLVAAFPGVALKHQRRFKVTLGHEEFESPKRDFVAGRADILVTLAEEPLVVLELKREGLGLTSDDEDQGYSYAALAGAPLYVVSNGADTRIFQTHDRQELDRSNLDQAALKDRLRTATQLAQEKVRGAIGRLLGTDFAAQAIDALNDIELGARTGGWDEDAPFVHGFLVPRKVNEKIRKLLTKPKPRALVVTGPPLCGKSSALRELATTTPQDQATVLYLDASACRDGVFRRLANLLSARFGWPASVDDARRWVTQLAADPARPFVICLDAPSRDNAVLIAEIDEILAGDLNHTRLVLAIDETDWDDWRLRPNRREHTRLGNASQVLTLENYDDDEFVQAHNQLAMLGGVLVHGAAMSPELRVPWVLRAAAAPRMTGLPEGKFVVIPPLLGLESLQIAQSRFSELGELLRTLAVAARIHLEVVSGRRGDESLASLFAYRVPRERLREQLANREIRELVNAGLLLPETNHDGETRYVVRVPTLFAKLLANRLFDLMVRKLQKEDDEKVVHWLALMASRLPFGDVIGADVVHRLIFQQVEGSDAESMVHLLNAFLDSVPNRKPMSPGAQWVAFLPNAGLVRMELDNQGHLVVHTRHSTTPFKTPVDPDDLIMTGNIEPWLILSQSNLFGVALQRSAGLSNVAAMLLLQLGQCPHVLRHVSKPVDGFHAHTIGTDEFVCGQMGIIEPITWAITVLLENPLAGFDRTEWVKHAVAKGSLPLLSRLDRALSHMAMTQENAQWAQQMLDEHSAPAWKAIGEEPPHSEPPAP